MVHNATTLSKRSMIGSYIDELTVCHFQERNRLSSFYKHFPCARNRLDSIQCRISSCTDSDSDLFMKRLSLYRDCKHKHERYVYGKNPVIIGIRSCEGKNYLQCPQCWRSPLHYCASLSDGSFEDFSDSPSAIAVRD